MPFRKNLPSLAHATLGAALVGVACGAASALFLRLLAIVTVFREQHPALVYALPIAGALIGVVYDRVGKPSRGGMDVVLDATVDEAKRVPKRMAPLVLVGTLLTHLFGGSAGREGTAVQMGASLAEAIGGLVRARGDVRRKLLLAGIAGGFGAVFGTPWAGIVFALEVGTVGKFSWDALVPALVASFVGDLVARAAGASHTAYPTLPFTATTPLLLAKLVGLGALSAFASVTFVVSTSAIKKGAEAKKVPLPLRMAAGGLVVATAAKLGGLDAYLGLGVPTIERAFRDPSTPKHAFLVKLALTAVTIGSGFLGGEVTPLFFVGATCGAAYAASVSIPIALGAACGMAAVFGAAANTPLALVVMVIELVGPNALPHVMVTTVVAFALTGRRGLYGAQRFAFSRTGARLEPPVALRDVAKASAPGA